MKIPHKVFKAKNQKVGFSISPERLAFIRQKRLKYTEAPDYTDILHIRKELEYSYRIFSQIKGLQIINVTNSSIEEIANKVIEGRRESSKKTSSTKEHIK
jgi:regulator of PEP synthase PpsR (kinase-PPPase family)